MLTSIAISREEHASRAERLCEHLASESLSGAVLFDPYYVLYYTGFAFIPTERPIAFVVSADGEKAMLVPRLEVEHAGGATGIERIAHYDEYPGDPRAETALADVLAEIGISGRVGADQDGYPWILGYRGPTLSELAAADVVRIVAFVEAQMAVKSEAELALIRESAKWGNLAHRLLQSYTRPGLTETEVTQRASNEATVAMLQALGPLYRAQNPIFRGAHAGYRGQIGRGSAIPHALANNVVFQEADVLVTGATAPVWGYLSELERTMVIGPPSDEQRRLFDHMVALQDIAFGAIRPGARCADVDRAVRAYFDEHDLWPYWRHHTGHAIGLRYHEGPFLDTGDDTEIVPGMVFTVEPGLYSPELGGFRHSDTAVVTEDGIELVTYYPRDLDSLTLPA
ncbi:MAG TPA: Xaa-Pro peptidase family protein [Gaiellaceae bacterium]|nr:Xaa-Pro peptidase family protein [Gaiellaceae bacterium]